MKKIKKKIKTRKLVVGISVNISDKNDNFWTNGIKQNAVTLQKMFSLLPNIENSYLVNFGTITNFEGTSWEPFKNKIIQAKDFLKLNKIDALISATVTPTKDYIEVLNKRGVKCVKQVMGNEYEIFSEQVLFEYKDIAQTNFYGRRKGYDANWISPHFFEQNKDLMEVISDAPAYVGPYIWDKIFIEKSAKKVSSDLRREGIYYIPSSEKEKRICTFEPNINLVKTCITPMLAIERMYRKEPELIKSAKVFGSFRIKKKNIFVEFAKDLEVYLNKKMTFEARFPMALSLFNYTDIVIAHQRNLDLNYAYFDAAWLGYPLVHNSKTLEGLGYYYEGWDADSASNKLIEVAKTFDDNYQEYLFNSQKYISQYFPENKENIASYAKLFEDLFK